MKLVRYCKLLCKNTAKTTCKGIQKMSLNKYFGCDAAMEKNALYDHDPEDLCFDNGRNMTSFNSYEQS